MELDEAEKERKWLRTQVRDKLLQFATRIPAFMYLTDEREHTLEDVMTKIEPDRFETVTGLSVADIAMLRIAGVFNETHMNDVILSFRRAEEASPSYTGVERHPGLRRWGLFNTVITVKGQTAVLTNHIGYGGWLVIDQDREPAPPADLPAVAATQAANLVYLRTLIGTSLNVR